VIAVAAIMVGFCVAESSATTLAPISGDEQIQKAESIFRGRVDRIDTRRDWSKPQGPVVSTVRFTPLVVYKGKVGSTVSLDFLGGAADGVELKVEGMPQFQQGQEYVLFVSGVKNQICPVVGWTEGQLAVNGTAGAEDSVSMTRTSRDWLRRTTMARSRGEMPSRLKLSDFETSLRARITQVSGGK